MCMKRRRLYQTMAFRMANCFCCLSQNATVCRGATTAEKLRGTRGLGPNTGAQAPRARPEAGLGVGAGGGRPSRCGGPGVLPPEIFLKTHAKSCILVVSALISRLPMTCISEQTTSMSRAKSVPKFQLFSRGCASGC